MGQIMGLKIVLMFSALVGILLGSGFLINEVSAGEVPLCNGLPGTIIGTEGRDRLRGTNGPDVIIGLGGNDKITGAGGDDTICAGDGNDFVNAGDGEDWVDCGAGRDFCHGGDDDDQIFARDGEKDRVHGGLPKNSDYCQLDTSERSVKGCEIEDRPYEANGASQDTDDRIKDFISKFLKRFNR